MPLDEETKRVLRGTYGAPAAFEAYHDLVVAPLVKTVAALIESSGSLASRDPVAEANEERLEALESDVRALLAAVRDLGRRERERVQMVWNEERQAMEPLEEYEERTEATLLGGPACRARERRTTQPIPEGRQEGESGRAGRIRLHAQRLRDAANVIREAARKVGHKPEGVPVSLAHPIGLWADNLEREADRLEGESR